MRLQAHKVTGINSPQPGPVKRDSVSQHTELVALHVVKQSPTVALTELDENEKVQLVQCEAILRQQLGAVFEVGSALMTIRDGRLYRATHASFEAYCRERLCISRSYAWRVLGATERFKLLPASSNGPKPTNESQIRPFLAIEPKDFPKAWEAAVKAADNGRVTQSIAREVVREISGTSRSATRSRAKRLGIPEKLPLGQVLSQLLQARRHVEHHEAEEALAALDAIERLLFRSNGSELDGGLPPQTATKTD